MHLWLSDSKLEDQLARQIKKQGLKHGWKKDVDRILLKESLTYVLEIDAKLIRKDYDNLLADQFRIN